MLTRLYRVASIVEAERALRLQSGGSSKEIHHGSSGGTSLWEEGGEEKALRYLLEGSKVNLLIRLLEDHVDGILKSRVECRVEEGDISSQEKSSHSLKLPKGGQWLALETSLAVLLPSVWAHREGIQVTDLNSISLVLSRGMLATLGLCEGVNKAPSLGATGGAAVATLPRAFRPTLATLLLRLLEALGGPAALGAMGDKIVAALSKAGVFSLFPFFLLEVGARANECSVDLSDPVALVYSDTDATAAALSASSLSAVDVLKGAGGVAALMALESFSASVKPALATESNTVIGRLSEEAAVMEAESDAPVLFALPRNDARQEGGLRNASHEEALPRLKRFLLEGLLAQPPVLKHLDPSGRPASTSAAPAAGKKMLRPILDYCDFVARQAAKR